MRHRRALAVFLFFFAVAVVFTAPVSLSPFERVVNDGDPLHISWILAWDAHQIVRNPLELFESNSFYPYPRSLAFSEHLLSIAMLAAPFFYFTGNALFAQNMALLLTLTLSAFGMYLLVKEVFEREDAALVAAMIYTFHTYNLHEVPRLQLLSTQWLPIALLFMHRSFEKGGLRNAALFALFFVLQGLAATYYLFYFALLLTFWLPAYALWTERGLSRIPPLIPPFALAAALFGLLSIPYFGMLRDFDYQRSLTAGVDLLEYAQPPVSSIFSSLYSLGLPEGATPQFLGIVAPLLAVVGIVAGAGLRAARPQRLFFWLSAATASVGLVLSLGPEIRVAGESLGEGPYLWIYEGFPLFRVLRSATRMSVLVHFGLAVLAGAGASVVLEKLRPAGRPWARGALLVLLPFQHFTGGHHGVEVPTGDDTPEVYRWLAGTPDDEPVVELPLYPRAQLRLHSLYLLYSTQHWRPVVFGRTSFYPPLPGYLAWELRSFPDDKSLTLLERLGVKRVVVHPRMWPEGERRQKLGALRRFSDRLEPEGRFGPLSGTRHAAYGQGDERVFRLRRAERAPSRGDDLCTPTDEVDPAAFRLESDAEAPTAWLVDRDPSTKWRTRPQLPSLVLDVDLGREEMVSAVKLPIAYPHDEFPRDLTLKAQAEGTRFERVDFRDDVETKWEIVDALVNAPGEAAMILRFPPRRARRLRFWVREGKAFDYTLPPWSLPELHIYRACAPSD